MKIGILGGTRFIGLHLIKSLLEKKYEVSICNRGITKVKQTIPNEVVQYKSDRTFPKTHNAFFKNKYDALIDLSGYSPFQISPILNLYSESIGQYIFCSTSSVFKIPPEFRYKENAEKTYTKGTYGGEKSRSEDFLLKFSIDHNLPVTIFRPQAILGKYDAGGQASYVFQRLHNNLPIIIDKTKQDFLLSHLYVKDLVNAIILSINNNKTFGQTYNLASDNALTQKQFIEECSKITNKKPNIFLTDKTKHPNINIELPWHDYHLVPDNTKIKNSLGLKITSISEALSETSNWLLENTKLLKPKIKNAQKYILNNEPLPISERVKWQIISNLKNAKESTAVVLKKSYPSYRFIKSLQKNITKYNPSMS
jgi:nucleoside-diphosphate-sugar epimerase